MSVFSSVEALRPKRSVFDLSYEKKFTADFSYLYPVCFEEVVPGDYFNIGVSCVVRFNPLVAPVMHEVKACCEFFFVPIRIIDPNFEESISGGVTGASTKSFPRWKYVNSQLGVSSRSLWDFLGMPTDISPTVYNAESLPIFKPVIWPLVAYRCIFAEFYADQNLFGLNNAFFISVNGGFDVAAFWNFYNDAYEVNYWNFLNDLSPRSWKKDYFTSALPFRQRGPSLAIGLTGYGRALWPQNVFQAVEWQNPVEFLAAPQFYADTTQNANAVFPTQTGSNIASGRAAAHARTFMNANAVDVSTVGTFDVSDLRRLVQLQKWQERNARSGARYIEFLHAHFGVAPRDERLDRPEFIGGARFPIAITEVLQTSNSVSGSPQANMAGHGISVGGQRIGSYRVTEYGYIVGLLSIMPRPCYEDRMDRQWLRRDRFDMYFPEFAHLSEQAIFKGEIRYNAQDVDQQTFGYQGIYNEMRFKHDMVCSGMRYSAAGRDYGGFWMWHMSRHWTHGSDVQLNRAFLTTGFNESTGAKRVLAASSAPAFLVNWKNHIKAVRPLPYSPDPGLLDHF